VKNSNAPGTNTNSLQEIIHATSDIQICTVTAATLFHEVIKSGWCSI